MITGKLNSSSAKLLVLMLILLFAFMANYTYADEVDIPAGGSLQLVRSFGGIGIQIADVQINVSGDDADLVSVEVDDFQQIDRTVEVTFTISVDEEAEVDDELSVQLAFSLITAGGGSVTYTVHYIIHVIEMPPEADFTGEPTSGYVPLRVSFTDMSRGNIIRRLWNFGDDETSDITNPVHIYEEPGHYTVSLTVANSAGEEDTRRRRNYITVEAVPPEIVVDDDTLDFGEVALGNSKDLILTISNAGEGDLTVSDIRVWERSYSVDFEGEFVVLPDSSHDVTVTFTPRAIVEYAGELGIISDDPENRYITIELRGVGSEGNAVGDDAPVPIPDQFFLLTVKPNPFNSATSITYGLPVASRVSLIAFDLSGRRVATLVNCNQAAGRYTAVWNGSGLPTGIYFVRMETADFNAVRKLILTK